MPEDEALPADVPPPDDGERRRTGRSESSESFEGGEGEDRRGETLAELPGSICAPAEPSALDTARRIRGRSESSLLEEELLVVLAVLLVLSELEDRRSRGRSGSLSLLDDELLEEVVLSSELPAARRSFGRSGLLSLDEALEELPAELFEEELFVMGCDVSSVEFEARECSSMVPTRTSSIFDARYALFLSCLTVRFTWSPG